MIFHLLIQDLVHVWPLGQASTYIYRCTSSQTPGPLGTPTNWWPHVSCQRFTWRHPEVSQRLSSSKSAGMKHIPISWKQSDPTEWFPWYQAPPGETIIDWLAWLAALENNPSTNFQLGPLSLLQLKLLTLAAPHVVQNHDLKSPWRSPSGTLGTSS